MKISREFLQVLVACAFIKAVRGSSGVSECKGPLEDSLKFNSMTGKLNEFLMAAFTVENVEQTFLP